MNSTIENLKPPVILQVLPGLRSGGVERGTLEIARAVVQGGGKAIVASEGGPLVTQLTNCGATHVSLPLASKNPFKIWWNSLRLASLIRKHKVDVVHARSRAPAWSAWMAAKKTDCRFVTTFHGTYGLQNKCKQKYNSVMTRGDRVIAISNFIADHIHNNYRMDETRVRIIHRGADLRVFNPFGHSAQRMIELAKQWRLPDDMPVILFPGRITRWKGQKTFLEALAALPHRHFFAILLGDDKGHENYRKELEALISQSGLEGHVRIARHTHYIVEAYMLSRLVVSTSLEPEAFGRVVLEAQAMGKPVIASDHGAPRETVLPGETGWLVKPGDVKALADAIDHALKLDDAAMQQLGEKAYLHAQNFSVDKMCQETLAVYQELLV